VKLLDDYLTESEYNDLTTTSLEYAKVHWVGQSAIPANALHELVLSTYPYLTKPAKGATAWYNIRPVDPKWHSDIESYCTVKGFVKEPQPLPEYTFIYYVKSPDSGGNLQIGGPRWGIHRQIEPIQNRLVYFDATLTHRVAPYEGNRVSIGIIWWEKTPEYYGDLGETETKVLPRIWEIEDEKNAVHISAVR
jgi:hypothetical protein